MAPNQKLPGVQRSKEMQPLMRERESPSIKELTLQDMFQDFLQAGGKMIPDGHVNEEHQKK